MQLYDTRDQATALPSLEQNHFSMQFVLGWEGPENWFICHLNDKYPIVRKPER